MKPALAAAGLCVALGGCANMDSIYRQQDLGDGARVMFVDAKQRAVLTSLRPVPGDQSVQHYRAYCAEPSPDVFTVFAQSMAASASFGQDATSVKAAGEFATSLSEAGSTIPRTQTINMLREMMYRTCERYISGAISPLEFSIQAIRDQRVMVSILAIEQLTGAVTPHAVALSASGTAAAGQSSNDAVVRIDDSYKAWQSAETDLGAKQTAFNALNVAPATPPADGSTPVGACDAIAKTLKDKPDTTLGDADKATNTKCVAAKGAVNDAKDARDKAKAHYDELAAIVANGGTPVSAGTSGQILAGGGNGGLDQASTANVAAVALSVEHIVSASFEQDETQLFCLKALEPGSVAAPILQECLDYLKKSVELKAANADRQAAETRVATNQLQAMLDERTANVIRAQSDFDKFWAKFASANPDVVDTAALNTAVDAYIASRPDWSPITRRLVLALKNLTSKADVAAKFRQLPLWARTDLTTFAK